MTNLFNTANQIQCVTNFKDLVTTPFEDEINAICYTRRLAGNFAEIANKIHLSEI